MRISDWSSAGCSSDLRSTFGRLYLQTGHGKIRRNAVPEKCLRFSHLGKAFGKFRLQHSLTIHLKNSSNTKLSRGRKCINLPLPLHEDRKSVVKGKSGAERVDLGGRRRIKKKNK